MTMSTMQEHAGPERVTIPFPTLRSPEELDEHIERTYGAEVLKTLRASTGNQAEVVQKLKESGLNGRSEAVERMYRLHQQEFDRKESLLGKVWGGTKDVLTAPFRWTWSSFKKHPILTTLGVAAVAAGAVGVGFYLAGEWELLMSKVGLNTIMQAGESASELGPMTPPTPPLPGGGTFEVSPPVNPGPPGINTPT